MGEKTCVLICGMHRSGTSAIAGCLQLLGYNTGKSMMPATPENPKGYFENIKCWQLNERLMSMLGVSWDQVDSYNSDHAFIRDKMYLFEIEKIIAQDFLNSNDILIKDPRISILLPYWIEALEKLNYRVVVVVPFRSPISVCFSLNKRDGFSVEKSAFLYSNYLLRALADCMASSHVIVNFEEFIVRPNEVIKKIVEYSDIKPPIDLKGAQDSILTFVDPELVHGPSEPSYEKLLPLFILEFYEFLKRINYSIDDEEYQEHINKYLELLDNLLDSKSFIDDNFDLMYNEQGLYDDQIDHLNELLSLLKTENKELAQSIDSALLNVNREVKHHIDENIVKTQSSIEKNVHNIENSINNRIDAFEDRFLTKFNEDHERRLTQEIDRTQKKYESIIDQLNQKNENSIVQLTKRHRTEIDHWERKLQAGELSIENLNRSLNEWHAEHASLKNSLSSRIGFFITWPLRRIRDKGIVLFTLLGLLVRSPKVFFKHMSFSNAKRLVYSNKSEPSDFLVGNIERKFEALETIEEEGSVLEEKGIVIHIDEAVQHFDKVLLRGWTISREPIERIKVVMSEISYDLELSEVRHDVLKAFPDYSVDEKCGFDVIIHVGDDSIKGAQISVNDVQENILSELVLINRVDNFSDLSLDRQYSIYRKKLEGKEKKSYSSLEIQPLISIIVPVYNVAPKWLDKCIESVINQVYPNWELCLFDDYSTNELTIQCLEKWERKDKRILVERGEKNQHISAASNGAVAMSSGDYLALLDNDDELHVDALYEVVKAINQHGVVDYLYTDEDKIDESGKHTHPHFKPDWSPETFESMMYVCHLSVIRKEIFLEAGGFRLGFEGSQDFDLILRVTEISNKVIHIAKVLYHWRMLPTSVAMDSGSKSYAYDAAVKGLTDALKRKGYVGRIERTEWLGLYRTRRKINNETVTIIIPFKDDALTTLTCVKSIQKSSYSHYRVMLVSNNSTDESLEKIKDAIKGDDKFTLDKYDLPFNYSAMNNHFAKTANSDYLIFLNNDIEVLSKDWIESMLECAVNKEIGCVGAKLLYPDSTVQHVGVIIGMGGIANHAFKGQADKDPGYHGYAQVIRNYSAVTAACMMIRTSLFKEVGGFDEVKLPISYNDIDLCLRLTELGYRHVATPFAKLYHFESKTRALSIDVMTVEERAHFDEESRFFEKRWSHYFEHGDPYYNINLTLNRENFALNL